MILGVKPEASEVEIKSAYKYMVKHLHPDAEVYEDIELYQQVVEAYDFLKSHPAKLSEGNAQVKPRIIGQPNTIKQKRMEQEAFDRWYVKRQEEKKQEFERRAEIMHENEMYKKKQDEDYKKAMEAINNIIIAETLKKMIHQNDKE